jgi:hypothetical protein
MPERKSGETWMLAKVTNSDGTAEPSLINGIASILAAGVLRLRAKRNLSDTGRRDKRSPKTDLISTFERSVHDHRKQR